MNDESCVTSLEMNVTALRLLHRTVSEGLERWPGGPAEEQECLATMKLQLYAALMEHLLDVEY
jgi:hypothetical protein